MDSPAQLLWGILFSSIGLGFFIYGKKQGSVCPLICAKGQKEDGGRCIQISCGSGYFLNSSGSCEKRPEPAPKPRTVERESEPRHRAAPVGGGGGGKCFSFNGRSYCE